MSYSLQVQQLIEAVKRLSLDDDLFLTPTIPQLEKMNIQFNMALGKKKELRIPVIRLLTNLPISSTKQLTRKMVSVIIDQTLDGRSDELIRQLANAIEA
jgi:hypothetical protein